MNIRVSANLLPGQLVSFFYRPPHETASGHFYRIGIVEKIHVTRSGKKILKLKEANQYRSFTSAFIEDLTVHS